MSKQMWGDSETQYFYELGPEQVLSALDKLKLPTTGRCLTLNSMENRVYEIELDESPSVVVKFYRPGRWTFEQIKEEHQFLLDLLAQEIGVIAPSVFDGETLFFDEPTKLWFAVFPKKGGRHPDEMNEEQLLIAGRLLGRLHSVGAARKFSHRLTLSPGSYGQGSLELIEKLDLMPSYLKESFHERASSIIQMITPLFKDINLIRIHGDCHWGNIIWREGEGPFLLDFDDTLMGPAVQDIWLCLPGRDEETNAKRLILLEGYEEFRSFSYRELKLIEPLRTLRFLHFAAWLSKRRDDPAFLHAFPYFRENGYWDTLLADLNQQEMIIRNSIEADNYQY